MIIKFETLIRLKNIALIRRSDKLSDWLKGKEATRF
jgi:hypothetical protein